VENPAAAPMSLSKGARTGTGAGGRDRRALAGRPLLRYGGPAGHGHLRRRDVTTDARVEDLLRRLAPQVLGALVRHYGHFEACEDAVQEALLAAATQWPERGLPESPRGWLITVASRRLTDQLRSDSARRRREDATSALEPPDAQVSLGPDARDPAGR